MRLPGTAGRLIVVDMLSPSSSFVSHAPATGSGLITAFCPNRADPSTCVVRQSTGRVKPLYATPIALGTCAGDGNRDAVRVRVRVTTERPSRRLFGSGSVRRSRISRIARLRCRAARPLAVLSRAPERDGAGLVRTLAAARGISGGAEGGRPLVEERGTVDAGWWSGPPGERHEHLGAARRSSPPHLPRRRRRRRRPRRVP